MRVSASEPRRNLGELHQKEQPEQNRHPRRRRAEGTEHLLKEIINENYSKRLNLRTEDANKTI